MLTIDRAIDYHLGLAFGCGHKYIHKSKQQWSQYIHGDIVEQTEQENTICKIYAAMPTVFGLVSIYFCCCCCSFFHCSTNRKKNIGVQYWLFAAFMRGHSLLWPDQQQNGPVYVYQCFNHTIPVIRGGYIVIDAYRFFTAFSSIVFSLKPWICYACIRELAVLHGYRVKRKLEF